MRIFKAFLSVFLMSAVVLTIQSAAPAYAQAAASDTAAENSEVLTPLLDVLRDDTARERLVQQLEELTRPQEAAGAETKDPVSLGRRIAVVTQSAAHGVAETLAGAWETLGHFGQVFDGLRGSELQVIWDAFGELLLVIVLTVAIFLVLRRFTIPIYRAMGSRAEDAGPVRTLMLFLGSLAIDSAVVILAWAIGYAITTLLVGQFGQIGIRQTLYLNAFLLVELTKVAIRALLSPSTDGLRVLPLGNRGARRINRIANVVVSVLGYGQLLVVPIVNSQASRAAGSAVSALLALFVLLYLVIVVIRSRKAVATWLQTKIAPPADVEVEAQTAEVDGETVVVEEPQPTPARRRGFLASLAQHWHWFTLAYLAFMFIIVVTQPPGVVSQALLGSAKIAIALILGALVSSALSGLVGRGIALPETVNERLPLLQPRLNSVVPKVLIGVRYVILLIVLMFAVDTINLLPVRSWMESRIGLQLTGTIFSVALILLIAYAVWLALTSWVDYRLNPNYGAVPTARETTLLTLLRNAATVTLIILTLMFCLSEIGLDIGPLLASAGVLGLAIGFGAQKMVQDIITGIFIQFENAINVGDVITVGGTTGVVEKLTIRSVSLRDVQGCFHLIPFSSVDMVSNFTREFSYFVCDMGVAYRENIEDVRVAMLDAFEELRSDPDNAMAIIGDAEWFGVNSFGDSSVNVRLRIKTIPGKQWGLGRAYNGIMKRIFDERGIEIPFPYRTLVMAEEKDGRSKPIRVAGPSTQGPDAQIERGSESRADNVPIEDDDT